MEKKFLKILVFVFIFTFPNVIFAADISISPATNTYTVGDRVRLKVIVNSSTPINAVSANIKIPTSVFSIESVTKESSILNFWVTEPSFSNANGAVVFEGVSLGGNAGGSADIVTLNLRATQPGSGTVSIGSAQILANDGQGTNITGALKNGVFTVNPAPQKEVKPVEAPAKKVEEVKPQVSPEPEQPQKKPELNAPEIILVKKFGEQAIAGNTEYPKAQALITFIDSSGYKVFITSTIDEKGEFSTLVPQSLKPGIYKVTVVAIKSDMSNSLRSNELEVKIGNSFSNISIWATAAVSVLLLFVLGLLLRSGSHVRKGKKSARDIVKKSFKVLEQDIKNNSIKDLKQDLNDAEKVIDKEIKDIGSI